MAWRSLAAAGGGAKAGSQPFGITVGSDGAVALANPQVRQRFVSLGQDFFPTEQMTPAAFATFQKNEIEQRWPIIKAAGIKPD